MGDLIASGVARFIERHRFPLSDEKALQAAMAEAFEVAGYVFAREVRLSEGDIVDFMIGDVAVEVKIKGARREIFRQCRRYCTHDRVGALVLATKVAMSLPSIHYKPCFVASLGRAWL